MSDLSYRIGRALGTQRSLVVIGLVGALGAGTYLERQSVERREREAAAKAAEDARQRAANDAAEAQRLKALTAACASGGEFHRKAQAEAKAGKFGEVVDTLSPCLGATPVDVKALFDKAQSVQLKRIEAKIRQHRAAEKAAAKKEGVRIGMSRQDVLDSSWGRPNDINRTTTARGVHEQWVYDGGYLYFDDGVLTSIQN